jgi:DNA-directed RNA polymerase specialized sigma24 family protein
VEAATQDVRALIRRCVRSEPEAQIAFQEAYGSLIYSFPVRIFRLDKSEASEFYLYAFESGRIFRRMQGFEGRNSIQFTNYLSFYVLRALYLDWLRTRQDIDTISLDAELSRNDPGQDLAEPLGQRVVSAAVTPEESLLEVDGLHEAMRALGTLEAEMGLLIKLLCLAHLDLEREDVRLIAQVSGRGINETLEIIDDIETAMGQRATRWRERQEKITTIHAWIMTYQRRLRQLEEQLVQSIQASVQTNLRVLQEKRDELLRKLAWRYRQQESLRREAMAVHIRPSYKELARLLNWPIGTVCSRVARAREELSQAMEGLSSEESPAGV